MAVIFHVLKEEFERLQGAERAYTQAIAEMPRGTPRLFKRRNTQYLYLQYREGKKVIQKYIGPHGSDTARVVLEKIEKRKRFENLLKETKDALKEVRKALRGKV